MKRSAVAAFTLLEMLMVMIIIAIIASLIVSVAGFANKKATASRTTGEIQALSTACESYKVDNGDYPRQATVTEPTASETAPIDPRYDANPLGANYLASSLFLYQQLSGDSDLDGRGGDGGAKMYTEFKPQMLGGLSNATTSSTGQAAKVTYLQDPYGFSYGYSTAGAKAEADYRLRAANSTTPVARDTVAHGYNMSFDLWSTAGTTGTLASDSLRARWIRNW